MDGTGTKSGNFVIKHYLKMSAMRKSKQKTPMDCSEQGAAARKQRRSLVGKLQHSGGRKVHHKIDKKGL